MRRRHRWTERCAEILRRNAQHYTNAEIAALIEAETGLRFTAFAVSRRRSAMGLDRSEEHTSELQSLV